MDTSYDDAFTANPVDVPLSYDETVAYDDQLPTHPSNDPGRASLAERIGHTKVYLLSEAAGARSGKRKHEDDVVEDVDIDADEGMDPTLRGNAILFNGSPISHLPTHNIFAYAKHFDAHPIALEWIDDTTCILVFASKASARSAHRYLSKSAAEEPSDEGFLTAKPIPIALWPPEERITRSLGTGEGLKGIIRMRWATGLDVKQKGAQKQSEFYKKYGTGAGKQGFADAPGERRRAGDDSRPQKRRKNDVVSEAVQRAELDDEIDTFLAEGEPPRSPSPPSKMRSDYLDSRGRTLLERTSAIRAHPDALASRITAPLPRRSRPREREREWDLGKGVLGTLSERLGVEIPRRESDGGQRGGRRPRPRKTQDELDAELDDFLNSKD